MRTAYLCSPLPFWLTPVPPACSTVILYSMSFARSLNPRSIPGYLNIIRLMHLSVGLPIPLDDGKLRMIKKDIAQCLGTPSKQKLLITPEILLRISNQLDMHCSLLVCLFAGLLLPFTQVLPPSLLSFWRWCNCSTTAWSSNWWSQHPVSHGASH